MAVRSRESGEEEEEEEAVTHSPEPELMEADASEEPAESSRSDRLHPEQDLAHIFRVRVSQVQDSLRLTWPTFIFVYFCCRVFRRSCQT